MASSRRKRRRQHFNQPEKTSALTTEFKNQQQEKKEESKQIATRETSLDFYMNIFDGLPNPDPVLKKLRKDIEVYEDLAYDSRVSAVITSRKSAVSGKEWDVIGENTPQSDIDFYKSLFKTYNMRETIDEMLEGFVLGYKPTEIIWGMFENRVAPVQFVGKPSRWFVYDDDNKLRYLTKANRFQGIEVPDNKFIVTRNKATYDNPYGKAVMSPCFWPVTFRRDVWKWWVILTEKFGIPFLTSTAPSGAKEDKIEEMADMLAEMVQDGVAVVPEEWNVQVLETRVNNGKSDSIHKTFMDSVNIEIAMAVLGTNLTTEVQGGSFAATKSHMEVRADIVESDTIMIENSFNELIQINHSFNFSSEPPKFKLFSEEEIELDRAKRDLDIQKGNPNFSFTPKYYQEKYNLSEDDFTIDGNTEVDQGQ